MEHLDKYKESDFVNYLTLYILFEHRNRNYFFTIYIYTLQHIYKLKKVNFICKLVFKSELTFTQIIVLQFAVISYMNAFVFEYVVYSV